MKLQLSEMIPVQNQDLVLQTLELCLKDVSLEVARSGNQITAYGIGPSHRAKNRNDKTTLQISSEQGMTVIHVDANYQASALLGDQSQDGVIRSKFELLFERMKNHLNNPPNPLAAPPATLPTNLIQSGGPVQVHQSPVTPATSPPGTAPKLSATTPLSSKPKLTLEKPPIPQIDPQDKTPLPKAEPRYSGRSRVFFASLILLCLLLIPILYPKYSSYFTKPSATSQTNTLPDNNIAAPSTKEPAIPTVAPPSETSEPEASTSVQPNLPEDKNPSLRHRLEEWGAALRSRNAAAQASFYSTRVHPYFMNQDVDNDFILHDKQTSIQQRQGLWTVKLENIEIYDETPSTARVHLIKHFIDQPAQSSITERFVHSQLHLKQVNGQWYITAERDLP